MILSFPSASIHVNSTVTTSQLKTYLEQWLGIGALDPSYIIITICMVTGIDSCIKVSWNIFPVNFPVCGDAVASTVVIGINIVVVIIPETGVPVAAALCPGGIGRTRMIPVKRVSDGRRWLVPVPARVAILGKGCAA